MRASEVVSGLRSLSKKATPQRTHLNLNHIVDEVVLLVRREVFNHGVSVQLELAPALPPVLGDRVQLQQVIMNLLVKAIQAMAAVTDRPRELFVRTHRPEGEQLFIEVRDTGIGIDPENLKQLFNAFFSTKPNGMGMGLSICRSIIEAHGGRIWASRNDGPGATFHVTLPADLETAS